MAYPPNEGGIGGKFRRRPARTPSKPYDRPPTALRGVRGGGPVTGERGGWMSKILDPASRLIANGAAKLFASLFPKRLAAPPLEPGENLHSGADGAVVSHDTSTIPLSDTSNREIHNEGSSVDNQKNISDFGIVELEQLFKQNTFTMVEFNRLEGLLRSRTVESCNANHENSIDKKGKSVALASDDLAGSSRVEKRQLVPSDNLASQNPMNEANSPAEVAKAFMGLKASKDSSLSGSLRDQVFNEETNLKSMTFAPRRLDLSVAPRSVIRFSGIPELPQSQNHVYQAPKSVGRFAMYRMSRSPYFNVNRVASPQGREISRNGHSFPVSSQWTPNSVKSCGRQALKRGITALDDEYGSLGPIRRIRQKSNLVSHSRIHNSGSLTQKSLYLEEKKHDSTSSESAEDGMENSIMLPVQSNEKTHKLLQQLDKLIPSSPKERPSKLKAFVIDESPSKLTIDMLNGRALKSMEDIKSYNFLSTEDAGRAATSYMRENMDEESSLPQTPAYSGINSKAPQANGVSNTTVPSKNITQPVPMNEKKSDSSVSFPISKKPAFRISAPEDFFDLDDDEDGNTNDLFIPSTSSPSDSITKISVRNDSNSKTRAEKLLSSSMLSQKDEKKAAMLPVLPGEDNGFAFPIASDPSTESQPPPTPTMQTSKLHTQKETAPKPVVSSESKNVKASTVATNIGNSSSENAGIKIGEEIRSEAIQTTSSSATANESSLVKSEVGKTGELLKSPAAVSGISTASSSALFSSEASSIFNTSNSSVNPSPNMDPVPSNPKFGNYNSTNTISNNSSLSSAAATFSTTATPLFQPLGTSKSNGIEANTFKASSFSVPASTSQDLSFVLPTPSPSSSSSTTSMASPLFSEKSGTASTPAFPAAPICGLSASTQPIGSSSSLSEIASVFGSTNGSTASVFGATEKPSAVSFGANNNNSSQNSSMPTAGASDNNSQKTDAISFGGDSKFTGFGATENKSEKSSAIAFGGTDNKPEKPAGMSFGSGNGLIFGSQSTQMGQVSQASTSQFGAFSSSPSFGLSKSTSGGFGNSAFGSASSSPNPFTTSSGVAFSSSSNSLPSTNIFGSSSQASSASPIFSSSPASVFGSSTSGSAAPFQFGSSSSGSANPPFTFGSSASGPATAPFAFNSSSTSAAPAASFAFNSSSSNTGAPTPTPTPTLVFGMQKPAFGFGGTSSANNDQMSVEDSMTDASNQAPSFPAGSPGFMFGSPAPQQNGVPNFSFGGAQNASAPFQAGGSADFNPGGSFSLGSGAGGDKSARKIIKVKRGLRGKK